MSESDAGNLIQAETTGPTPTIMVADDDPTLSQMVCRLAGVAVGQEAQGFTDPVKRIEAMSTTRHTQPDDGQARQGNGVLSSLPLNLQPAETELIRRAMRQAGGNMSKCAALLVLRRRNPSHGDSQYGA